jgi:hypothetical protein
VHIQAQARLELFALQKNEIALTSDGEGEVEEGPEIIAIREALSGPILRVSQYADNGIFPDIDSFIKLSHENAAITRVEFYPLDKNEDDALREKIGEGLANLESLKHFIVYVEEGDTNAQPLSSREKGSKFIHRADPEASSVTVRESSTIV